MPRRSEFKLSKRVVDTLSAVDKDAVFWDRDLAGFGVRVYATGRKVYVVQTRGPDGPKRVALGRHGEVSADEARKQAAVMIDRIKRGADPVPAPPAPELTIADLAERCMRAHVRVNCKARTASMYRLVLDKRILPALGGMPLGAVDRAQVSSLHYELRDTPYMANRVIQVLSRMFSLAEAWGLAPPGANPCGAVRYYRERNRERFLTPEEFRRLGRALDKAEAEGLGWPRAVAAIRLLMLTGCRHGEITTLRWDDVDRTAGELRIRDAKSGPRMVPLTPAVEEVLADIPRIPGNPLVIAGRKPDSPSSDLQYYWNRIRIQAGLKDVRIHDLRHSYASRALALGESLSMIAKLLGHSKMGTTARYAHLARDTEKASAARVGDSIGTHIAARNAA